MGCRESRRSVEFGWRVPAPLPIPRPCNRIVLPRLPSVTKGIGRVCPTPAVVRTPWWRGEATAGSGALCPVVPNATYGRTGAVGGRPSEYRTTHSLPVHARLRGLRSHRARAPHRLASRHLRSAHFDAYLRGRAGRPVLGDAGHPRRRHSRVALGRWSHRTWNEAPANAGTSAPSACLGGTTAEPRSPTLITSAHSRSRNACTRRVRGHALGHHGVPPTPTVPGVATPATSRVL